MVVPNAACEVEGWSVVQVMMAEVPVIAEAVRALITGAPPPGDTAGVEKVKLDDVDGPAEVAELTA